MPKQVLFCWACSSEALFLEDIALPENGISIALEENNLLTVTLWHPSESYMPTAGITVRCRLQYEMKTGRFCPLAEPQ